VTVAAAPLYVLRARIGPIPTTLLEVLVLLTVGLYAATAIVNRGPFPRRTGLEIPIALFLVAGAIGVFVAPDVIARNYGCCPPEAHMPPRKHRRPAKLIRSPVIVTRFALRKLRPTTPVSPAGRSGPPKSSSRD
jgi:hypothetical protein